ncbi:MAG: Ig-like domain-containing protein [Verrucomicrobiota bacterium]
MNSFFDELTTANGNDQEVFDRLTGQGHVITLADDDTVAAADAAEKDLVLISSSANSAAAGANALCRNTLRLGRTPVMCYEPGLYDELLLQTATTFGNAGGHTSIAINSAQQSHPLAAGKSGTIDIVELDTAATISSSALPLTLGTEAILIATNATPGVDEGRVCIWAYDHGAKLADNSTVVPTRRVAFFYNATTAPFTYNANAIDLFDAALRWILEPPAVIPIALISQSPQPGQSAVPLDVTITAEIEDGNMAAVNPTSVRLEVNGSAVNAAVNKTGTRTTVSGKPAANLPQSTVITVELVFSDNANPPLSHTNRWQFTTERPALKLPPFNQSALGLVSIEAENFHTNTPAGGRRWEFAASPAGFSSEGTMYALPDSTASIGLPAALTDSPRLDYRIQFNQVGTHYLWIRGSDGGGDSIHAGIDDIDPTGSTLDNIDSPDCCGDRAAGGVTLVWISGIDNTPEGRAVFEITEAGEHVLHLWMREDGMIVDKVIVTTDPNFVPAGSGPVQSPRVGESFPPVITSVTPAADAVGVAVSTQIEIILVEGTHPIAENSIQLKVDGTAVTPRITKAGSQVTVTYDPPGDLPSSTRVQFEFSASDTGTPPNSVQLTSAFTTDRLPITDLFQQTSEGLIVFEAENFHANVAQGAHRWLFATSPTDFSGDGSMYSLPELGANLGMPLALSDSPRLDFRIQFNRTGTHYVWIRGSDGGGDSVHAGIDDVDPTGTTLDNIDAPDCCGARGPGGVTLVWINGIDVTPESRSVFEITTVGEHVFHLWMREDGMLADKVVVTSDPNFVPTGQGPDETRGEKPKLTITRAGNGLTLSWTGGGTLEESDRVTGAWVASANQTNPQTIATSASAKFYRVKRN